MSRDKISALTGIIETLFDGDRRDDISDIVKSILETLGLESLYETVCGDEEAEAETEVEEQES
jgi:hypothetical protein